MIWQKRFACIFMLTSGSRPNIEQALMAETIPGNQAPEPGSRLVGSSFLIAMKTIQSRVTRNIKEDPGTQETNVWNVETALLEKLPDVEVSLVADPKEIRVEQIPGSKLDSTRTIFTIRTRGRSPLREGDTIKVGLREINSREMCAGVSYYNVCIQPPSKAILIVGVANAGADRTTSKSSLLLTRLASLAGAALHNPNLREHEISSIEKRAVEIALPSRDPEYTSTNGVEQVWIEKTHSQA
jgi:hypothetical protein